MCELLYCFLLYFEEVPDLQNLFLASNFSSHEQRNQWETAFNIGVDQIEKHLRQAHQRAVDTVDKDMGTVSFALREVRGTLTPEELTPEYRRLKIPMLFARSACQHYNEFLSHISNHREQFPIISLILENLKSLEVLHLLPDVVQFLKLSKEYFNDSLTLNEAHTTSIKQAVERIIPEQHQAEAFWVLFKKYQTVWNTIGLGENRFECEEFTIDKLKIEVCYTFSFFRYALMDDFGQPKN